MASAQAALLTKSGKVVEPKQYAALPYIIKGGSIEVCLITSRRTKRLIVPKGWPKKGLPPHKLAALEAFEEAGLKGRISKKSIGRFRYWKQLNKKAGVKCDVEVFPMLVNSQAVDWPERGQRTLHWLSLKKAAKRADDAGLSVILRRFKPHRTNF